MPFIRDKMVGHIISIPIQYPKNFLFTFHVRLSSKMHIMHFARLEDMKSTVELQ